MTVKPANLSVAGHLHAKTCEATYRNFFETGRSSQACMRTRRQIGNGGLVDEVLVQGQFTLLFGEICDAYFPPSVRLVEIPKAGTDQTRPLGIPSVSDRIAQMVVKLMLEPHVEPHLHPDSYGYRPGKSALDAVGVTRQRCWRRNYVIDLDIKGFFDNLDWDLLLRAVRHHTDVPWILLYVERWLKAQMQHADGEFLGFSFPKSRGNINVAPKSLQRFKHCVKELTGRSWGVSMEHRLSKLRSYLRGWMGYFGLANQLRLFAQFDGWVRRRIRMCYWKQWRCPKRRRELLIRLGVPPRQAIRHARSRKSYWHMAKTIASGVGLTNASLAEQGLISLKTLWVELAPLRRTA